MSRPLQADLLDALRELVGEDRISVTAPDLVAYSGDFWPKQQIWKLGGEVERYGPGCVIWPADEAEIRDIVTLCANNQVPLIPYGGGSGVCGGTLPLHGGVVVDMKRLNRILEIDPASQTVRAQTGVLGQHLEEALAREGLTLGHYPSSIMCSTLGGWLATRSAGQMSSLYGKIEDMVESVRVVAGTGKSLDTGKRCPGEPDWTQVLVGSEGTLGLLTEATLRVHRLPERRWLRGYRFHHLSDGIQTMRQLMQAGLRPCVMRLYDPFDSLVASRHPTKTGGSGDPAKGDRLTDLVRRGSHAAQDTLRRVSRRAVCASLTLPTLVNRFADLSPTNCLMILGFEGANEAVDAQVASAKKILARSAAMDAGREPAEAWLANRYSVSFRQSEVFGAGAFSDTMEVATTWDRAERLYTRVREVTSNHAFVMAHFSHAYRIGCGVYFTFVGYRQGSRRAEALYDRVWASALEAVQEVGATVSHHHGVGLLKRDAMDYQHGAMGLVWHVLKDGLDPHGILNPGKLFPDAEEARV